MAGIGELGDYRVLLLPDHPTPVAKMTHTKDPVPFVLAGHGVSADKAEDYSEKAAQASGVLVSPGHLVMDYLVNGQLT
jgi:2,3-bisphosphoglycerate-independent phosphoglycerate mutase